MSNAILLFKRLSQVEKLQLLGTTNTAQLEYLADSYRSDLIDLDFEERTKVLQEVRELCRVEFAHASKQLSFFPWTAA